MTEGSNQNRNHYDFSASQIDSPVGEFKSLSVFKNLHDAKCSDHGGADFYDQDKKSHAHDPSIQDRSEYSSVQTMKIIEESQRNRSYDFKASQEDSPVGEYKPVSSLKNMQETGINHFSHDAFSAGTDDYDQNKENACVHNMDNDIKDSQMSSEPKFKEKLLRMTRRKICYIHSEELVQRCNEMIKIPLRVICYIFISLCYCSAVSCIMYQLYKICVSVCCKIGIDICCLAMEQTTAYNVVLLPTLT